MQSKSSFAFLTLAATATLLLVNGSPLLEQPERSALLLGGGSTCTPGPDFDWSYNTDCTLARDGQVAPANWGALYPECNGVRQSPIDISATSLSVDCTKSPFPSQAFQFDNGSCMFSSLKLDISPKGWTVKFDNNCSVTPHVKIGGKQYNLLQFHLHSLSEHTFSSALFDAELHLVHVDAMNPNNLVVIGVNLFSDSNSILDLTLLGSIGITIAPSTGEPANAELKKYLDAFTQKAGGRKLATVADFQVMPYAMLPSGTDYFNYLGSLTTPPCNQIVTWVVMKEGITITSENLGAFRDSLVSFDAPIASEEGNNNRPTQPLNGRTVYSCTMV